MGHADRSVIDRWPLNDENSREITRDDDDDDDGTTAGRVHTQTKGSTSVPDTPDICDSACCVVVALKGSYRVYSFNTGHLGT